MKKYFAQIEDNKVANLTSYECEENQVGINWLQENIGGTWVFAYNETGTKVVGCGWDYHAETGGFSGVKEFGSWILNENYEWEPPVPKPEVGDWGWDEGSLSWVAISGE